MPAPVTFLRIANPKQPGDYLVLAERDFDPAVHTRFVEPVAAAPVVPPAPAVSVPKSSRPRGR